MTIHTTPDARAAEARARRAEAQLSQLRAAAHRAREALARGAQDGDHETALATAWRELEEALR